MKSNFEAITEQQANLLPTVRQTVTMINNGELKGDCFCCVDWEKITDNFSPFLVNYLISGIDNSHTAKEVLNAINERKELLRALEPQQEPTTSQQYKTTGEATNEAVSQNKGQQQEPTPESVEESLKPYFKPTFKGMSNSDANKFKERFVPDLLTLRGYNSKKIATFLSLAYKSNEFNKNNGKVSNFKDWLRVCSKAIQKTISLNYKPSQLDISTIECTYIYFTMPTKR